MATSRKAPRGCCTRRRSPIRPSIFRIEAIGYSLDWFAQTLQGGTPRPADDQIWFRKEIGTLIALIGFVVLLLGVFDGLLEAPVFSHLRLPEIADGTRAQHAAAPAVGAGLPPSS